MQQQSPEEVHHEQNQSVALQQVSQNNNKAVRCSERARSSSRWTAGRAGLRLPRSRGRPPALHPACFPGLGLLWGLPVLRPAPDGGGQQVFLHLVILLSGGVYEVRTPVSSYKMTECVSADPDSADQVPDLCPPLPGLGGLRGPSWHLQSGAQDRGEHQGGAVFLGSENATRLTGCAER